MDSELLIADDLAGRREQIKEVCVPGSLHLVRGLAVVWIVATIRQPRRMVSERVARTVAGRRLDSSMVGTWFGHAPSDSGMW